MKKQPALSVVLKCRLLLGNIGGACLIYIFYIYSDDTLSRHICERVERGRVAEQKAACTLVFGVQAAFGWRKTKPFGGGKGAGMAAQRHENRPTKAACTGVHSRRLADVRQQ